MAKMSKRNRLLRSRMIKGKHYVWTYDDNGDVLAHLVIRGLEIRVIKGLVVE